MKGRPLFLALLFLLVAALLAQVGLPGYTRVRIQDGGTGRKIFSGVVRDGEEVVMTWKNSLFGLQVTEVFQAQRGVLVLTSVTFADPQGPAPPVVRPSDVYDLYHTGGAFTAAGLSIPFRHIAYRVGEIGEPKIRVKGREIDFKQEVGFGGSVILTAAAAKPFEIVLESGNTLSILIATKNHNTEKVIRALISLPGEHREDFPEHLCVRG
jgi:hypothetical protein